MIRGSASQLAVPAEGLHHGSCLNPKGDTSSPSLLEQLQGEHLRCFFPPRPFDSQLRLHVPFYPYPPRSCHATKKIFAFYLSSNIKALKLKYLSLNVRAFKLKH